MRINSDFRDLLHALSAAHARFLVVGAYAVIQYTVPRYTKDLDLWVEPTRRNAQRVRRVLKDFGAPLANLSVDDLCRLDIVFQIGVAPVRIDILTSVPGLEFGPAYRGASEVTYGGIPVKVLSLDDVMQAKRTSRRLQDRIDLRRLEAARKRRQQTPPTR